jgi:hypothetical protein
MSTDYLPWPQFAKSFGYIPPEAVVQIPMDVFKNMITEGPPEKVPEWAEGALESDQEFVLML